MAPIDGAIGLKIKICNAYTTDVNISKAQPSKASGLGGVASQRSKSAPTLFKYRYCFMNAKWNSERHMKQSISPASLNLESWNLVSATSWPSPDHTPIFSQIGGEMTEKSPILRVIKQIWEFSDNQSFLRHFFTDPAENWCVNRGET